MARLGTWHGQTTQTQEWQEISANNLALQPGWYDIVNAGGAFNRLVFADVPGNWKFRNSDQSINGTDTINVEPPSVGTGAFGVTNLVGAMVDDFYLFDTPGISREITRQLGTNYYKRLDEPLMASGGWVVQPVITADGNITPSSTENRSFPVDCSGLLVDMVLTIDPGAPVNTLIEFFDPGFTWNLTKGVRIHVDATESINGLPPGDSAYGNSNGGRIELLKVEPTVWRIASNPNT